MAGGIRVARVERRGERSDRTRVGRLRLRLGLPNRRHQVVERFGQRVELAAGPGPGQSPFAMIISAMCARARQVADRGAERPGQPEAQPERRRDGADPGQDSAGGSVSSRAPPARRSS